MNDSVLSLIVMVWLSVPLDPARFDRKIPSPSMSDSVLPLIRTSGCTSVALLTRVRM